MFGQSYYPSSHYNHSAPLYSSPISRAPPAYAQPQLSARDKYLAALAQAKAAEEEYLAYEALEEEERVLRRRLEELKLQKQHREPDRLASLRLQIQEEERKQAEIELARRQEEQVALEAHRSREEHVRARAQLELRAEQRHKEELLRSITAQTAQFAPGPGHAYRHHHRVARQPRFSRFPLEDLIQQQAEPTVRPSRQRRPAQAQAGFDFEHLLQSLVGSPEAAQPSRVPEPRPKETLSHPTVAIEQALKAIFGDDVSVHSTPAPSTSESKAASTIPTAKATSTPSPKTESTTSEDDIVSGVEQLLKGIFGDAVSVKRSAPSNNTASASTSAPAAAEKSSPPKQERPTSPISFIKEQLKSRLQDDEASEVRDTIQAIFNSLHDTAGPVPSASVPAASSSAPAEGSSAKGKAKADTTPAPESSHDLQMSLATVDSIETAYRKLVDDFVFPSKLDFSPTSSPASSDSEQSLTSRLAYTSTNAPVRYYEQTLSGLLSQLDSVESYGHEELRTKRKEVVGLVEGAIDELEREVEGRWRVRAEKLRREREAPVVAPYEVEDVSAPAAAETPTVVEAPAAPEQPASLQLDASSVPASSYVPDSSSPATDEPIVEEVLEDSVIIDNSPSATSSPSLDDEKVDLTDDSESSVDLSDEEVEDASSASVPSSAYPPASIPSSAYPPAPSSTSSVASSVATIRPTKPVADDHEGSDWSEVEA